MTKRIGVIVARFQVDTLTPGHIRLLKTAFIDTGDLLIILGSPASPLNAANPLSFDCRKTMVEWECELNGISNYTVIELKDQRDNKIWTKKLDDLILANANGKTPILYGGRDCFIPFYSGQFECHEIDSIPGSATEVREHIIQNPSFKNKMFREGVIYAHGSRHFQTYTTVDGALLRNTGQDIQILLGRRAHETEWRLPGGFIEEARNETFAEAVAREVKEETNCESEDPWQLLRDFPLPKEWRIRRQKNVSHRTILLVGWYSHGRAAPSDDLDGEVRWWYIDEVMNNLNMMIEHHKQLIQEVKHYLNHTATNFTRRDFYTPLNNN